MIRLKLEFLTNVFISNINTNFNLQFVIIQYIFTK